MESTRIYLLMKKSKNELLDILKHFNINCDCKSKLEIAKKIDNYLSQQGDRFKDVNM
jgi:hypothetical protein